MIPAYWYFVLAAALFSIGTYAVASSRSAIKVLMGIELMLNAANVNFAAFGSLTQAPSGETFALFSIALAAAEAAVGLAIFVTLFRLRESVDVSKASALRW
ncbi:MAG TPA: NADH-quinone oxidoreductase subunit NuoK [Candidatus Thermoplasmatota archaeon]|jgi:NADH-quinone oxidoreductase subunit K|nr:NADH-quinone oxidoreductase subunit NuoK [Candidatus Thermoplasmatota archaeon]